MNSFAYSLKMHYIVKFQDSVFNDKAYMVP